MLSSQVFCKLNVYGFARVLRQAQHKLSTQQLLKLSLFQHQNLTKELAENNIKLMVDGIFWKNILKYGN